MATIIVCDSCNERQDEAPGLFLHLVDSSEQASTFEICPECFLEISSRLSSERKLLVFDERETTKVSPTVKTTRNSPIDIREIDVKVGDDEIKFIPTRVDYKKIAEEERLNPTCPHLFKTYEDGQIKCCDAPPDSNGGLSSIKGCGEVLSASSFVSSPPRHFEMK